jgi:hypothetical protein
LQSANRLILGKKAGALRRKFGYEVRKGVRVRAGPVASNHK